MPEKQSVTIESPGSESPGSPIRGEGHPVTQSPGEVRRVGRFFLAPVFPVAVVLIAVVLVAVSPGASGAIAVQDSAGIDLQALELLESNCFGCHGHDQPDAGLDLEHFRNVENLRRESEIWNKVLRRVRDGSMPPVDAGEMAQADRERLAEWIDRSLHDIDCSAVDHPGQVTIRRLNRLEYRNSIRDLLLLDYEPAAAFPGDDSGYGFDNIGDVLSLPPVLMEKYLNAAESISRQVIQAPEDFVPVESLLPVAKWKITEGVGTESGKLGFYSNGEASIVPELQAGEEVVVRIRLRADQAGDEPVIMQVWMDKSRVGNFRIREHDQPLTKEVTIRGSSRERTLRIAFTNDFYDPDAADPGQRDRNLVVEQVALVRFRPAGDETAELQKNFLFAMPEKKSDEAEVAGKVLSVWASRFFRRPGSADEVRRLVELFQSVRDDGSSFERAMQVTLQAILVSPKFLFKVERPAPEDGSPRELNSFELATSLSYFLWSTTPDNELLQTALREDLGKTEVLRATAARMLRSDKCEQLATNFAVQWLQLRGLEGLQPDPELFAGVDAELLRDMRQETSLFFLEIMREDRSLLELLSGDFTFLNSRLARHYGLPVPPGAEENFVRVSLEGTVRGGLLTQGSILAVTSNPNRTSPVKRGKWILENLLGEPPPPAVPEVMPLEQQELTGTLRQQMEQHRTDPACASCHSLMDPLGFSLEHFDAVGRWRDREGDSPVDASAELPSGETFSGAGELRQILLQQKQEKFVRCLTEKMMIYALGRGLRYEDQCAVNEILQRLKDNDFRFSELVLGIVESRPFRQRQRQTEPGE